MGSGFNASPMTYAVDGKQCIAIASGLCRAGEASGQFRDARVRIARTPGRRQIGNATMVFGSGCEQAYSRPSIRIAMRTSSARFLAPMRSITQAR